MRKKKIVLTSNSATAKTGFGKHMRVLLTYLYKTGKYDIVEYKQALPYDHPSNDSTPWKSVGSLPNDQNELSRYLSENPSAEPLVHYGDYYLDRVIQEEKPDVFIAVEDIWGVTALNKKWWNEITCVAWTPIDSTPLHDIFSRSPELFKNLWVKALFAQEELAKIGVKSEFYPALIDNKPFKQLKVNEKLELRRSYGIADDTLVFGFVFRNQYRKLIGSLMESLKKFKNETGKDAKLWVHTDWSEGWPLERFIEEYGLDRNDILSSHICNRCREVTVRPFYGQKLPCCNCGQKETVSTVSAGFGPEDEGLSDLYNLCDAYIHPANSGGFEMPILEAMFCGLPVATIPYSYGSNFVRNKDVYPIEYTLVRDFHQFFWNKAVPYIDSIVDFMVKISNMSRLERYDLGKSLRRWALEEFDSDKICKRVEDFIDNVPFTNYDFNFSSEKNENYPMPDIEDEREFVIDLFKNILHIDVVNNQEEIDKALEGFKLGFTKEMVYQKFIEIAVNENQKHKKVTLDDLLSNDKKKKAILVVEGTPEECIQEVPFLEEFEKSHNPEEWSLYLAVRKENLPIFSHLIRYHKVPYSPFMNDPKNLKKEGLFDSAIYPILTRKLSIL